MGGLVPFSVIFLPWIFISFNLIYVKSSELTNRYDLCYLKDGGSSQTFTVNEATPINSSIGSLQVTNSFIQLLSIYFLASDFQSTTIEQL